MAEKKVSGVYVSWPRPDFTKTVHTNKNFRSSFYGALTYVHYEISASDLKKEVVKYLKKLDSRHPYLERIKDFHENRFITIGKYIYLLNHGCDIPEDIFAGLFPALEKVINEEEAKIAAAFKETTPEEKSSANGLTDPIKPVISIQDRLKEKAKEAAGEVEGWIDDFMCNKSLPAKSVEEFVNLFKSFDLKAPHIKFIIEIFERRAKEIATAVSGEDKFVVEAYCNFTKPELKKFDLFYKNLFKACDMLQEAAKVERAPRKKKPVSTEKLVSKLKFKKDDAALGIVSVNPSGIIGAKEVWFYNTKTRKLAQYRAEDGNTLSVKGTSLLNFSSDSVEKTLRKPGEALAEFKKASKVKLRTFLKDLSTTDTQCTGKINEHHVILRIDK